MGLALSLVEGSGFAVSPASSSLEQSPGSGSSLVLGGVCDRHRRGWEVWRLDQRNRIEKERPPGS